MIPIQRICCNDSSFEWIKRQSEINILYVVMIFQRINKLIIKSLIYLW